MDLARRHRLSTQAVRNYETDGILPDAERSPAGYRRYTTLHALALDAFLALVRGHGHPTAASIMRAVNRGPVEDAFRLIDQSHAELLDDRRTLEAVEVAVGALEPVPQGRGDTFIGPLSRRLGLRPATLRSWERAGLVHPRREPQTGYRVYTAADVRDALLAAQLRRGGYRLEQIAPVIAQVRAAGGVAPLESLLREWRARLSARARAMLAGAAALDGYLGARPATVVEVVAYDPSWPERFAAERRSLAAALPTALGIEHIGSTSVPGLAAKPILDILVVVPDVEQVVADLTALEQLGYVYRPAAFADPDHRFFRKDTDGRRSHHLHVFASRSATPDQDRLFRSYLTAHPDAARRYADAKRRAARLHPESRASYAAAKEEVLRQLLAESRAWGEAQDRDPPPG